MGYMTASQTQELSELLDGLDTAIMDCKPSTMELEVDIVVKKYDERLGRITIKSGSVVFEPGGGFEAYSTPTEPVSE